MTHRRGPRRAALLTSAVTVALLLPLLAATGTAASADDGGPVVTHVAASPRAEGDEQDIAEAALAAVEELVEPADPAGPAVPSDPAVPADPTDAAAGDGARGKNLTLALRDLALTRADLPKGKRRTAARLLARPTDAPAECRAEDAAFGRNFCYHRDFAAKKLCDDTFCVHWSKQPRHRVPGDNNGRGGLYPGTFGGAPDYVEFTLSTARRVANAYARAGYDRPPSDGGAGGTEQLDIYLADLWSAGLYGYCATDTNITAHTSAPSYCVLDSSFMDYGIHPRSALRATVAHEYFHSVQFGYDVGEDAWMMEATATWAEDEIFDGINDNRMYLRYGPLGTPHQALDLVQSLEPYGAWIFFRYLGEKFPQRVGGMPVIVREIWERAGEHGANPATDNVYSVQAIQQALRARRTTMATQMALFSLWNQRPAAHYEEGRAYAAAPVRRHFTLSARNRAAAAIVGLSQLATTTYRWHRGTALRGRWKVNLRVNLNSRAQGGAAVITIKRKGMAPRARLLWLNAHGNRHANVAFGPATQWISVTAVNGSVRYAGCNDEARDTTTTCRGYAVDERRKQAITARLYR